MKKFFAFACFAIMMACSTAAQAQNNPSDKQRMSREQLSEKQAKYIASELALDDATAEKFIKTYGDYQKEVWALGPKLKHKKTEMTDAEAEQEIKARMERSQKILDLREKYYKEYRKFLSPKQIQRVYELERKAMHRLSKKHHSGKGMGKKQ